MVYPVQSKLSGDSIARPLAARRRERPFPSADILQYKQVLPDRRPATWNEIPEAKHTAKYFNDSVSALEDIVLRAAGVRRESQPASGRSVELNVYTVSVTISGKTFATSLDRDALASACCVTHTSAVD
jgi:hypothetical protein